MDLRIFLNLNAIILLTGSIVFAFVLYIKKPTLKEKLCYSANFSQLLILAITLFFLVLSLSDLTSPQKLGSVFSFIILSNLYATIFNLLCRIVANLNK